MKKLITTTAFLLIALASVSYGQDNQIGFNCVADNHVARNTLNFKVDLLAGAFGPHQYFSLVTNRWEAAQMVALTTTILSIGVKYGLNLLTISRETLRAQSPSSTTTDYTCSLHTWNEIEEIAIETLENVNSRRAF